MPNGVARISESETTQVRATVYSSTRVIDAPKASFQEQGVLKPNTRITMDGLEFLSLLEDETIPVSFFDPQHRGVLDKLSYGNEMNARSKRRVRLQQMTTEVIAAFIREIDRVLIPSGHLFLWLDKFHLCQGTGEWHDNTALDIVDLITWNKGTFGMGYRTRRRAEYCLVLQKEPRRAKGVWQVHNIPDVVEERVSQRIHPHTKPVKLQGDLITAVSDEGDLVIDPAAGSFSVMEAAQSRKRLFLGCDLAG